MDTRYCVQLRNGLLVLAFFVIAAGSPSVSAAESTTSPELEQLQKQKAQYEAQKAMYDAQAQMYAAELAAAKARYGDVEPKFKGDVAAEAGAANAEAQLLSNQAVNKLAVSLASALVSSTSKAWLSWPPAQFSPARATVLSPPPAMGAAAPTGGPTMVIGKCITAPSGGGKPVAPAMPATQLPPVASAPPAPPVSTALNPAPGAGTPNANAATDAAPPWMQPDAAPTPLPNPTPGPTAQPRAKRLVLTTVLPDFHAVFAYNARMTGLRIQSSLLPPYPGQGDGITTASLATANLALKGLDTVLSFFRTDFSFKSVSVTATESEWITALSGALIDNGIEVTRPEYDPTAAGEDVATQIAELQTWLNTGAAASTGYDRQVKACDEEIGAANSVLKTAKGNKKTALEGQVKALATAKLNYEVDKARWTQFLTVVVNWVTELTTATSDGKIPVVETMKQSALQRRLCGFPSAIQSECGRLALTKLDHSVGNSYIKKNLWSGLGANPFYVMGGAVASLTVFGDRGEVVFAKTSAVHGKYLSVSKVPDIVNGDENAPDRPGTSPATTK